MSKHLGELPPEPYSDLSIVCAGVQVVQVANQCAWREHPASLIVRQMISPRVIDGLLELGRAGVPGTPAVLSDPDRAWRLLMVGDEPWQVWAHSATHEQLRQVIRGLILFCQANGRSGGSVSPVIPLYREFLDRGPDDEPELTSWIVRNRRNDYEPFGTIIHGDATTLQEFREYRARRARVAAEGQARDAERQRKDAAAKAERATARLAAAVRRGDVAAVRALIEAGAEIHKALPPGKSLFDLARENGRDKMVAFLRHLGLRDPTDSSPSAHTT